MKGKKKWLLIVIIMLIVIAPFTVVKAATPPKLKVPKKEIRVGSAPARTLSVWRCRPWPIAGISLPGVSMHRC